VQASALYDPYGQVRYSSGTMSGSYGFTGQRADSATGLDYYGARFYDPVAGQFASADTVEAGGLNRFAYVHGNPETFGDPSGHCAAVDDGGCVHPTPTGGGGSSGNSGHGITHRSGTQADNCIGKVKCVIFIDGVDIWPIHPKHKSYEDYGHSQWGNWTRFLDIRYADRRVKGRPPTWGGAFYVAQDGGQGMQWLHQILSKLATLAFTGPVTVVGHSNGAAAIFMYFATRLWGFSGDYPISKFVAFDAPSPWNNIYAGVTVYWRHWSPWFTLAANRYIRQHGIRGLYAWEVLDPVSGGIPGCQCRQAVYADASVGDAHLALLFNPQKHMELLFAL
jgi:RHS repeat-associated protein